MKRKNRLTKFMAPLFCTTLLFACSNGEETGSTMSSDSSAVVNIDTLSTIGESNIQTFVSEIATYSDDDMYTDWENEDSTYIQLNGSTATYEGSGAIVVSRSTISIRTGGVYVLSGTLDDGQIVVEAEDKGTVRLILNGVDINSSTSAPIYVKDAEKTVISLPEGAENIISDGAEYVYDDAKEEEPNSAIFSKDHLTINGEGKLVVEANFNDGIIGKDELRITGGNIEVTAKDDAIVGRDLLAISDGNFTIRAGGDGFKSTNDENAEKGNIALEGGTYHITADNDGIQAQTSLYVTGGDYTLATGGGSPETIGINEFAHGGQSDDSATTTETTSAKGLKATTEIAIGEGTFTIDSYDDAIHSSKSVIFESGEMTIASGDDAIHADSSVVINGGNITVTKTYEGIESKIVAIAGGTTDITSTDDGLNVGGGANASAGDDMTETTSENHLIQITGGYVYVNSLGDGLDSNGSFLMTDGTVVVNGPTDDGNGQIDYVDTFEVSGGVIIAAGSTKTQTSSDTSGQYAMLMTYSETQEGGTLVHIEDSRGNTIATFAPEKDYQSLYISSPDFAKDSSYRLYSGGSATGTETNGLYTNSEYSGGTKVVDFTISDVMTLMNQ
jgi:hypothetical protein